MTDVVIQLLNGLTIAGKLFLVSAGLTLLFGATRVINLAHGSFYMYGAFLAAMLIGDRPGSFWWILVLAPLAVAVLGVVCDVAVMRWVYEKEHLVQLVATFALFLILRDISTRLWSKSLRVVSVPDLLQGNIPVLGRSFPTYSLFIIAISIAVGLVLWLLLTRTKFGWRIRGVAEDPETLSVTGTNVKLLATGVFALGTLLAGLSGVIMSPVITVTQGLDTSILVEAFIVTVIGGLGSVTGAALGSIIIGLFEAFGVLWLPQWSSVAIYVALIVVLALRPWGLLGRPER